MPIEYKQPKLKDSLYGKMLWESDFEDSHWFSTISDAAVGEHEILIYADSPSDFMAVRMTHRIYENILSNLAKIKSDSVKYLLDNEPDVRFQKSRHKDFAAKKIEGELRLFCIKIFQDLDSAVIFDSEMFAETDEFVFTFLENDGTFSESSIDTF